MNDFLKKRIVISTKKIYKFRLKDSYDIKIPCNIFQTWNTKYLPKGMLKNVLNIKNKNPGFKHFLYDDNDCREFIKNNFELDVLNAFDNLKPGAYKADLWRYCILYKYGGIYLDIKYKCVNGFKLIALTEKEHFPCDVTIKEYPNEPCKAVWNGLIVSKPNNIKLLNAINEIVKNVKDKYYGNSPLDPTGPIMFGKFFSYEEKKSSIVKRYVGDQGNGASINNILILDEYKGYRDEQNSSSIHYNIYWKNRDVYH
jgi:hypothetical protein